jgi:hypothetical protein
VVTVVRKFDMGRGGPFISYARLSGELLETGNKKGLASYLLLVQSDAGSGR